jgi:hypothetical protein
VITSSLVVVADLDVVRIAVLEPKADTPLVVDRDRELAGSISPERMQPVSGRHPEELDLLGRIDRSQLAQCPPCDIRGNSARRAGHVELLGLFVRERLDHKGSVPRHVTQVKLTFGRAGPTGRVGRRASRAAAAVGQAAEDPGVPCRRPARRRRRCSLPDDSHARKIVGFRNLVAHEYAAVDDETVFGFATDDLPLLRRECAALLARVERSD